MSRRSTRTGRHILVVLGAAVALVLATLVGPPAGAAGRGSAGLVLHLKDGPPYRTDSVDEFNLQPRGNGA